MSSSEAAQNASETAACLHEAAAKLGEALHSPERIPDAALQILLAQAVRLYAVKAEAGLRSPFPPRGGEGVSADDVMMLATDMLHALNVQVFELSMWQAMTGNCIAPGHRVDPAA